LVELVETAVDPSFVETADSVDRECRDLSGGNAAVHTGVSPE